MYKNILINLNNKLLSDLPEEVKNDDKVNRLYLSNNYFSVIPNSVCNLHNLTHLSLSYNNISYIPSSIVNLKNLTYLSLRNNNIEKLPLQLFQLQLQTLILSHNKIKEIPSFIKYLACLEHLFIDHNKINNISDSINCLPYLVTLNVNNNHLTHINVKWLTKLTKFNISYNNIIIFPEYISNFDKLKLFCAHNNPLFIPYDNIPIENNNFSHCMRIANIMNKLKKTFNGTVINYWLIKKSGILDNTNSIIEIAI